MHRDFIIIFGQIANERAELAEFLMTSPEACTVETAVIKANYLAAERSAKTGVAWYVSSVKAVGGKSFSCFCRPEYYLWNEHEIVDISKKAE